MDDLALSKTLLFRGATAQEVQSMLACLGAERRQYAKGQPIYRAGEVITSLGLVLSGNVLVEFGDFWGNTAVLDSVGPGQIFAETYACTPGEPLMVNVVAACQTQVLFLNLEHVLRVCSHACSHHNTLIRNLLALSAQKNLNLTRKIFHTSARSIRARLLSYLSYQALRSGSRSFSIPFNRQQLADYLNVDRSALSNALSKMQREGILRTERNRFELLQDPQSCDARRAGISPPPNAYP